MGIKAVLSAAVLAGALGWAVPAVAQDDADALRSAKLAGEQADGYLGVPPGAQVDAAVRARINQVNIQRRSAYTSLAARDNVTVEETARATACQLLANKVDPGEWHRTVSGEWRQRQAGEQVALPEFCPK
jgi:hypothetical protein